MSSPPLHAHKHDHGSHHPPPTDANRSFAIGTALNLAFVLTELAFGFAANSLALIADAMHNFSDVIGLLLAWGALWLSRRKPTDQHTYGYRRSSILAALANAVLLFVAVGAILVEGIRRLGQPEAIAPWTVITVAAIGVVINTATALLFMRGRQSDINIRGAFLHMTADAGLSLGVVVAALTVAATGWYVIDPVVSLVIAAVILAGTWGLARDALNLSLDAVPSGIDHLAVKTYLSGLAGVTSVHDLHIWAMSTTEVALTAHLVRPGTGIDDELLSQTAHDLEHDFGIHHVTLQVEHGDPLHECRQASEDTV